MDINSLWIDYSKTKDKEIKKKLIGNYVELVRIIAGRMYNFYGTKVEYDDLIGYGVLGLIDSIDKFDITKDIKFETYAQIRIKGAIIDNIRKLDWIPRSLRKKSKDIQIAISTLENRLGRSPSNAEIAEEMGIEEENLDLILSDMSTFNMSSLEEMIYSVGDYFTKSEALDSPEDVYEKSEIVKILEKSIEILNKSEKLVITLYYYEELTYKEIGEVMELSESRISQIHSKAILKLKNNLMKQGIDNYS